MNAFLYCMMLLSADDGETTKPALSVTMVERIGTSRFQHVAMIFRLWFPANDRVVSGNGAALRSWDANSGKLVHEVEASFRARSSFDGERRVLVALPRAHGVTHQDFRVIDIVNGQELSRWRHPEWTESSIVSHHAKFAVLKNLARTISIVDLSTGREIDRIKHLERNREAAYPIVSLSPDDSVLAVMTRRNSVQFYELESDGKIRRKLVTLDQPIHKLRFSPTPGRVLLLGWRESAIWDVRSGKKLAQWNEPDPNPVSDAVFAKQGRVVVELTDVEDGIVRIRDTNTGEELRSFRLGANPSCFRIALSPDASTLAAGGYQGRVRLYDFASGKRVRERTEWEADGTAEAVAISDDGAWIASAEYRGVVSLWDRKLGWKRVVLPDDDIRSDVVHDTGVGCNFLTFLPGTAKLLSGSGIYHNSVNLWDAAAKVREQRLTGHGRPITGVAASRDGRVLASLSRDGTLRIWNREGKRQLQINAGGDSLSLSPDGSLVAVSVQREGTNRGNSSIPEPRLPVPTVELWNTKTGTLVRAIVEGTPRPSYGFYSVSFSHDGGLIAAVANDGLYVWEAATGNRRRFFSLSTPPADKSAWHAPNCGCEFSPKENVIAVPNSKGEINFYQVSSQTDKPIASLKGHDGPVNSVAWRRDGKYLVSAGNDSTLVLWSVKRIRP